MQLFSSKYSRKPGVLYDLTVIHFSKYTSFCFLTILIQPFKSFSDATCNDPGISAKSLCLRKLSTRTNAVGYVFMKNTVNFESSLVGIGQLKKQTMFYSCELDRTITAIRIKSVISFRSSYVN